MHVKRIRSRLRTKWYSMLHRDSHSGRPALVCEEWRVYERFAADVGYPPSGDAVLCMKNPELGFRQGNVFWGSKEQRLAHRRHVRNITVGSLTLNLSQWAERLGIHRVTLAERLQRHDEKIAVTAEKLPRGGSRIQKTSRRKRPKLQVGLYEREAKHTPDMETEGFLRLLSECGEDTQRIFDFVKAMVSEEAAHRAVEALHANEKAVERDVSPPRDSSPRPRPGQRQAPANRFHT